MRPVMRSAALLGIPLLLTDCATKRMAVEDLVAYQPHDVFGEVLRFTLAFNTRASMGLGLGSASRIGLPVIAIGAIIALFWLLRQSGPRDTWRGAALGLILAGATGNLIDRLRWDRGVVDFIDIGFGNARFWVFNVADIGVTLGALLLMALLWREGRAAPAPASPEHG